MPVSTISTYGITGAEDPTENLLTGVKILDASPVSEGLYEELDNSPKITFGEKGIQVKRQLKARWDVALDIAKTLKGWSEKVGDQWIYHQPSTFPRIDNIYVKNVEIAPFTTKPLPDTLTPNPLMNSRYDWALLDVDYDTPSGDSQSSGGSGGPETYITEDIEPHGEFLTLGTNELFWNDNHDGVQITDVEAPGKCIRTFAWIFTRHKMVTIPSFMFDYIGTVNEATVTSKTLRYTFAAETLLFDEPRLTRDITSEGVQAWRVTMRMVYRPWTWNKFWRPGREVPEGLWTWNDIARQRMKAGITQGLEHMGDVPNYLRPFKPYDRNDFTKITGG